VTRRLFTTGALISMLIGALASAAFAQGKSQSKGHGNSSAAPSHNELSPTAGVEPTTSATPLAWIDDATLLDPGVFALSMSVMRWQGADGSSEVDAPIVDAAIGLGSRVQLSASVPRVAGSADPTGAGASVGTSFVTTKIQVAQNHDRSVKMAVAPTLQLLSAGVVSTLGPNEGRVRFGLPVSVEVDRGDIRVYGGGGYFSPGLRFLGGAIAFRARPKLFVNAGLSRAWRTVADGATVDLSERDRKELSGGVAYTLTPHINAFAGVSTTVATLDANGAGKTISGGLSIWGSGRTR